MLEKKRSETLLKIISYVEVSQKLASYFQNADLELCPKQQIWYIDMKAIYIGEPKDRNIGTE